MKKLLILGACLLLTGCMDTETCISHTKNVLITCMETNLSSKDCLEKYLNAEMELKRADRI